MRFIVCVYLLAGLAWTSASGAARAQEAGSPQTPAERPATAPASALGTPPAKSGAPVSARASVEGSAAGAAAPAGGSASAGGVASGAAAPAGGSAGAAPSSSTGSPGSQAEPVVPATVSTEAQPGAAAGPAGAAALAREKGPPVAPSHDAERPVAPAPDVPSATGFSARLSFGVGGALWFSSGDTKLSRPLWFGLDLGYALSRSVTVVARASSWLPSDSLASEFLGAGAVYRLVAARLYVAGALGVSLTRVGPASEWSHYVQGLALQADVGQWFTLTPHTAFSVGAHFQFGSPLLGKKPDAFTSLQAGIFVALGLR